MQNSDFLGVHEAAAMLGISVGALRARVHRQQVPFIKWKNRVLFDRHQLARFLGSLQACSPVVARERSRPREEE
jgi:hypothetical protein